LGSELKSINYALVFFGCVVFHTIGTWNLPLIDRDEPRFAEASREMIERNDYLIPHFNNQFRFDKPPLTYWAQVVSYRIFGQNDFAARFPSAIAAALVAVTLLAWGSRIGDQRVGWWAAIVFTLSLQTFAHAKAAVADMWLVLFVTVAHWAGYQILRDNLTDNGGKRPTSNSEYLCWWFTFYAALALGFLAKGPIAWTPLLTLTAIKAIRRDIQLSRRFRFGRGILLTLAIVALWGIPALVRTRGEFFVIGIGRHVVGRSIGAMEGHGANSLGVYLLLLPFYFVTIFVSFFPWSIKLPQLVKRAWSTRDLLDDYLFAGAAVIFIIFSLIKTKLPHYTLPAFPLLSLLYARHFINHNRFFKNAAIVAACLYFAAGSIIPPVVAKSFPAYALFRQCRDNLRPEMEFGAVDYQEPSLVWYFRSRVRGFFTPLTKKNAIEFLSRPGTRFVIVPTSVVSTVVPNPPPDSKAFSISGFNIAKGKHVDLTLILKPD
jgi:4-amino-4-deoxy-L-arabinose transferase-like glycosyltransferase